MNMSGVRSEPSSASESGTGNSNHQLQKVFATTKQVVLYLVINEIVEFELTKKEKAVAAHMSASAGCVGTQGASHVRKIHIARAGERHWRGGLCLGRGATAPAGADPARCRRRAGSG